ncbi:hypothetical protein [Chryseobacterium sp. T1]
MPDFKSQFDKMKQEASERWEKMSEAEREKLKERSRRFMRKTIFAVPSASNQSTSSK